MSAAPRRTWKDVTVSNASVTDQHSFILHLDHKPAQTPDRKPLALPSRALADAIAAEWQAQEKTIKPSSMPLTQLATTAIDRVMPNLAGFRTQLLTYAGTDLLCHRAPHPQALQEAQAIAWQPLLDWLEKTYQAPLTVTAGISASAQPQASLNHLQHVIESFGPFRLATVTWIAQLTGSLVLALALDAGQLDAEETFKLAEFDALWQMQHWGEDAEATTRLAGIRQELTHAAHFLKLLAAE